MNDETIIVIHARQFNFIRLKHWETYYFTKCENSSDQMSHWLFGQWARAFDSWCSVFFERKTPSKPLQKRDSTKLIEIWEMLRPSLSRRWRIGNIRLASSVSDQGKGFYLNYESFSRACFSNLKKEHSWLSVFQRGQDYQKRFHAFCPIWKKSTETKSDLEKTFLNESSKILNMESKRLINLALKQWR